MPKRRSKKQGPFANLMVYNINKIITMNQQKKTRRSKQLRRDGYIEKCQAKINRS
jgi:hypothetical protein